MNHGLFLENWEGEFLTTTFSREDLKNYFEKIAEVLFRKERDSKAVCLRAEGKSLSEVGNIICASREKIRQTELKAANALAEHQAEVKPLIYCLQAFSFHKITFSFEIQLYQNYYLNLLQ